MRIVRARKWARGSAVHSLHVGFDWQTEGCIAHDRRLHGVRLADSRGSIRLSPGEIYWCTADVGWVTGHTYIVYGPLANGATR